MVFVFLWDSNCFLPHPVAPDCTDWDTLGFCISIILFSFLELREREKVLDSMACFCENSTALTLVFTNVSKIGLDVLSRKQSAFPVATGTLEVE